MVRPISHGGRRDGVGRLWRTIVLDQSGARSDNGRRLLALVLAMAVRYERERNRVLVTIYTRDDPMSEAVVREAERRAEEVSWGVDVVVVTTDEAPPAEE